MQSDIDAEAEKLINGNAECPHEFVYASDCAKCIAAFARRVAAREVAQLEAQNAKMHALIQQHVRVHEIAMHDGATEGANIFINSARKVLEKGA